MSDNATIFSTDINCDMGEGCSGDAAIMPFISSASIACGYHAGDEQIMQTTVELCLKHHVAIGAHPSFSDRDNFGRKEMNLSNQEIYDLVLIQIELLDKVVKKCGTILHHVKPHGALYNMSVKDATLAKTIANAVKDFDQKLILFGLSGSYSTREAKKAGLQTASEVFADRTYQDDGNLIPRSDPNALIEDADEAVRQTLQMIKEGTVTTVSGKTIHILAETICIHGDGKHAINFAKKIHHALKKEKITIKSISRN